MKLNIYGLIMKGIYLCKLSIELASYNNFLHFPVEANIIVLLNPIFVRRSDVKHLHSEGCMKSNFLLTWEW
jgi:hypothetical protein